MQAAPFGFFPFVLVLYAVKERDVAGAEAIITSRVRTGNRRCGIRIGRPVIPVRIRGTDDYLARSENRQTGRLLRAPERPPRIRTPSAVQSADEFSPQIERARGSVRPFHAVRGSVCGAPSRRAGRSKKCHDAPGGNGFRIQIVQIRDHQVPC